MTVNINSIKKLFLFFLPIVLGSCNINSNMMLKTPKNFKFSEIPENQSIEYKIAPDDVVQFQIYSNDGFQAANIGGGTTSSSSGGSAGIGQGYTVDFDGFIKLPILGSIKFSGLTRREAERMLEEKYAEFFIKPFVILNFSNKRVFVFTGVGKASVLTLKNNSTNLFEALASTGGIPADGKAKEIKVIRNYMDNPEIYSIDLSRLENIKKAHIILQANDIIYIEPRLALLKAIPGELTPWLALLSTFTLLITIGSRAVK